MKYLYAHIVNEKDLNNAILSGEDIITDAQNYDNTHEKIISAGYSLIEAGYELTGICDLYQYHYSKDN